jgi:hypothetical protein
MPPPFGLLPRALLRRQMPLFSAEKAGRAA